MMNKILTNLSLFFLIFSSNVFSAEEDQALNVNRFTDSDEQKDTATIAEYPQLKKYLFVPPKAPVYFGIGSSPISLMGSKVYFSVNLFSVHYITDVWDLELFSTSIGKVITNNDYASSTNFTFRCSPKFNFMNIFENGKISVGPILGYEYVKFDKVDAFKEKNSVASTFAEPLTVGGFIYGGVLSQTFDLRKGRKFKLSQYYYIQSYSIDKTPTGFNYRWKAGPEVQNNPENRAEMLADSVFMLDFSYLF